jgi:hypothetical protein
MLNENGIDINLSIAGNGFKTSFNSATEINGLSGTTINVDFVVNYLIREESGHSGRSHNVFNEFREGVIFADSFKFTSAEISDTNANFSLGGNVDLVV